MKLAPFDQMRSKRIASLYQIWNAERGSAAWPDKARLVPERLGAALLPWCAMIDIHRRPFRVYYRVAGSALTESLGFEASRRFLDEITEFAERDALANWFRLVLLCQEPLFITDRQEIFGMTLEYEGCCLPLGPSNDAVLSCVVMEDFLNVESWRPFLAKRRYTPPDGG
jgi:hypothetical protein